MAKESPTNKVATGESLPSAVDSETTKPVAGGGAKPSSKAPKAEESAAAEAPAAKKEITAQDLLKEEIGAIKIRKAKGSKNVAVGIAKVLATFNNTKICITDPRGNVISWSSSGKMNFRGSRKSTAYAAQVVAQDAGRAAMAHGLKEVEVHLSGPGLGRDSAVRALQAIGLEVSSIIDTTPVPHNGCRAPKRRRV
jgi:small subunit ribosomal protein S11